MTDKLVDLHIHTNYSDGSYSPAEVVNLAKKANLAAIAISDHDITDGVDEAVKEGKKLGIEVIPGVELSCEIEGIPDKEMHILAYYGNLEDSSFQKELESCREARKERAIKMVKKLATLKVLLDLDEVLKDPKVFAIGRMHLARLMVTEGFTSNIRESFDKYLGYGKPAYYPKKRISPDNAIKMILDIGAIPVLAHPAYGADDRKLVEKLAGYGLVGIETFASRHNPGTTDKYTKWAKEFELIATGGSDFHYSPDNTIGSMGSIKVPYRVVDKLKEYTKSIKKKEVS